MERHEFFENAYKNLHIPVIVSRYDEKMTIVFANQMARIALNPHMPVDVFFHEDEAIPLASLLVFRDKAHMQQIKYQLSLFGYVSKHQAIVETNENKQAEVVISANKVEFDAEVYCVFYLDMTSKVPDDIAQFLPESILSTAFHISYHTADIRDAVNQILEMVGTHVHASRAYIFETVSAEYVSNTYEWCTAGIEPAMQNLQNLKKTDHNYDMIVESGLFVSNDIRELPEVDYDVLNMQGIKSLAIIPLMHLDAPLGYVGFDDCASYRVWTENELHLLNSISNILASLLIRRKLDERVRRSSDVLQSILDNSNNLIYVNNIHTYELVFINKPFANLLGVPADELIGRKCHDVIRGEPNTICSYCPLKQMLDEDGSTIKTEYSFEMKEKTNGKWYLSRDSLFKWIDGTNVHILTATEITKQKEYEAQLEFYASTDVMTGVYNREWGLRLLNETNKSALASSTPMSLVFIDIDGLKAVNDTFGHDTGDELIIGAVNTLKKCVRKSDILFRYGGDEFVMILQCDKNYAETIMKAVDKRIADFNKQNGKPYTLSISYGITEINPGDDKDVEELLSEADKFMYERKIKKYAE
ncbi:diguanylate cyclase [Christensenellaceae bacterium OttesenSCG-928-M15]|nr:diguanylate cyclase [Christensenellaceae bacterium OttesenSCG-928-M15]